MKAAELRTVAQNRTIYGLRRDLCALGMEPEEVATLIQDQCRALSGQEHTSQLSQVQAAALIQDLQARLRALQPTPTTTPRPRPGRAQQAEARPHEPWGERAVDRATQPITARQLEVIDRLAADAGLATLPQRVGFYARQLQGRRQPRTQADADKLIEPLKAMILRRVTVEEVQARLDALAGHSKLAQNSFFPGWVADVRIRLKKEGKKGLTPARLAKLVEAEAFCDIRPPAPPTPAARELDEAAPCP